MALIAQPGQGRGGFYSYDFLENLVGCDIHSADRIVPEWQRIDIGAQVKLAPQVALSVALVVPARALVLRGGIPMGNTPPPYQFTWAFVLREAANLTSRLVVRERYRYTRRWASCCAAMDADRAVSGWGCSSAPVVDRQHGHASVGNVARDRTVEDRHGAEGSCRRQVYDGGSAVARAADTSAQAGGPVGSCHLVIDDLDFVGDRLGSLLAHASMALRAAAAFDVTDRRRGRQGAALLGHDLQGGCQVGVDGEAHLVVPGGGSSSVR